MDINASQLPTAVQLRRLIEAKWPRDATCWSEATDEIRDMARVGRELNGLSATWALDFSAMKTPAEWNSEGTDIILGFYQLMSTPCKVDFISQFGDWLY